MVEVYKVWKFLPSSCLRCGSFSVTQSQFCPSCFLYVRHSFTGTELFPRLDPIYCQYLFEWDPGASNSLSALFRHLKRGTSQAWSFYAEEFWKKALKSNGVENFANGILIPSPPRQVGTSDHAVLFAEALSKISGIPIWQGLERQGPGLPQKSRARRARQQIRLGRRENFSVKQLLNKKVYFVDDIVTTGSTAIAARSALASVKSFQVWALASRSIGCGEAPDLL